MCIAYAKLTVTNLLELMCNDNITFRAQLRYLIEIFMSIILNEISLLALNNLDKR